jgi:hypothetical protein
VFKTSTSAVCVFAKNKQRNNKWVSTHLFDLLDGMPQFDSHCESQLPHVEVALHKCCSKLLIKAALRYFWGVVLLCRWSAVALGLLLVALMPASGPA